MLLLTILRFHSDKCDKNPCRIKRQRWYGTKLKDTMTLTSPLNQDIKSIVLRPPLWICKDWNHLGDNTSKDIKKTQLLYHRNVFW